MHGNVFFLQILSFKKINSAPLELIGPLHTLLSLLFFYAAEVSTDFALAARGPAAPGRNFTRNPTIVKDKIQYFKELVFAYMVVIDNILNDQVSAFTNTGVIFW